jgi:hypothetical protein
MIVCATLLGTARKNRARAQPATFGWFRNVMLGQKVQEVC